MGDAMKKKEEYKLTLTREFIYDPESVKEGYRLLNEYLAKLFIKERLNKNKSGGSVKVKQKERNTIHETT